MAQWPSERNSVGGLKLTSVLSMIAARFSVACCRCVLGVWRRRGSISDRVRVANSAAERTQRSIVASFRGAKMERGKSVTESGVMNGGRSEASLQWTGLRCGCDHVFGHVKL